MDTLSIITFVSEESSKIKKIQKPSSRSTWNLISRGIFPFVSTMSTNIHRIAPPSVVPFDRANFRIEGGVDTNLLYLKPFLLLQFGEIFPPKALWSSKKNPILNQAKYIFIYLCVSSQIVVMFVLASWNILPQAEFAIEI